MVNDQQQGLVKLVNTGLTTLGWGRQIVQWICIILVA